MRLPQEPDVLPEINIVPMIDVIFAVLAFLIMSSLFLSRVDQFSVNLPEADNSAPQLSEQIVITLSADNQLQINGAPTAFSSLQPAVEALVRTANQTGSQPTLVVSADAAVSHGTVVSLMDQLQTVEGIRGLAIATQPPESPEPQPALAE